VDTGSEITEDAVDNTEVEAVDQDKEGKLRFNTLALAPAQFDMIKALNGLSWKKFPVHIHDASHSHAAIIVRMNRPIFNEGKVVVKHWLDQLDV